MYPDMIFKLKQCRMKYIVTKKIAGLALLVLAAVGCKRAEVVDAGGVVTEIVITDPASRKMTLTQGDSQRIRYSVVPEELFNTAVIEWTSSDERVAAVRNGRVNAYAPGTATVTASSGDAHAEVKVTVTAIPVESFTVPETVEMYTGDILKLDVDVKPDGTNAASLDWKISDPEIVSLAFDKGEALLTALKAGKCSISVGYGTLETKNISVTVSESADRLRVYYNAGGAKIQDICDGDELSIASLLCIDGFRTFCVKHGPSAKIDKSKLTVDCDNHDFMDFIVTTDGNEARVAVAQKDKFGKCSVNIAYEDTEIGRTLTRSFSLESVPLGYSSPYELFADYGGEDSPKTIDAGGVIYVGENSVVTLSIDGANPLKWSLGDSGLCTMEVSIGNEYWAHAVKITSGDVKGETELVLTDQKGGQQKYILKVIGPMFPESLYIIDERTGSKVSGKIEMFPGDTRTFRLSDDNFTGKWFCDSGADIEPLDGGRRAKVTAITANWQGCTVTVMDEADLNNRKFDLDICSLIDEDNDRILLQYGSDDGGDLSFEWKGYNTSFTKEFKVVDKDGYVVPMYGLRASIVRTSLYPVEANGYFNEPDTSIGDVEKWARSFTFSWSKYFAYYVTIAVTDKKGNSIYRKIVPYIDLSDTMWKLWQERKDLSNKVMEYKEIDLGTRKGEISAKFLASLSNGNTAAPAWTENVRERYYLYFQYGTMYYEEKIVYLGYTQYYGTSQSHKRGLRGSIFYDGACENYRANGTFLFDAMFDEVKGADGKPLRLKMTF